MTGYLFAKLVYLQYTVIDVEIIYHYINPQMGKTRQRRIEIYGCNECIFVSSSSFDSTFSSSGKQQSTGQTDAHCGSS